VIKVRKRAYENRKHVFCDVNQKGKDKTKCRVSRAAEYGEKGVGGGEKE
jgi:hypothetical protein